MKKSGYKSALYHPVGKLHPFKNLAVNQTDQGKGHCHGMVEIVIGGITRLVAWKTAAENFIDIFIGQIKKIIIIVIRDQ